MSDFSFRDVPDVYTELGIDTQRMGCVMLDVVEIPSYLIPPDIYGYQDESMPYVRGFEAAKTPHVTLLYGLLESGREWEYLVNSVLADWEPPKTLTVDHMEFFPTPEGIPFNPLVLRLDEASHQSLVEAHERLELLPHINTFPGYKSHITMGYVRKDLLQGFVGDTPIGPIELEVSSLNYGD